MLFELLVLVVTRKTNDISGVQSLGRGAGHGACNQCCDSAMGSLEERRKKKSEVGDLGEMIYLKALDYQRLFTASASDAARDGLTGRARPA